MRNSLKIYVILVITAAATIHKAKAGNFLANRPDFLTPCYLQDANYGKCFAKNFQVIYREWKDGIPGYEAAGSFDPLYVKRVAISQDPQSSVTLNADMTNVVIAGASNLVVKEASLNTETLILKAKLFVPKLRFDSDYKLDGRILNLALNGNGKCFFEIENIAMALNIKLKLRDEHGFTFTDVDKLRMKITDIEGLKVHFDNLFNGQKILEDSTNAVFNANWRDFYDVLRPAITEAVQAVMKDRVSKAFGYVPANYFIADIPTAAEHRG